MIQLESIHLALIAGEDVSNIFIVGDPATLVPFEGCLYSLRLHRYSRAINGKFDHTHSSIYRFLIACIGVHASIHAIPSILLARTSEQ